MVHIPTFVYICITMLVAILFFQKYFTLRPPIYGVWRMMGNCILFEFAGILLLIFVPSAMMLLICGSIAMGAYVIMYYRHKTVKGEY